MVKESNVTLSLPKGMKQTEIGLLPEDWEVVQIKDVTNHLTNGFVGVAKTHYTEKDSGITYLQGFNVEENYFNFTGIKKVTKEFHLSHLRSSLKYKDLLTVQTGDVGLTTFVPKELEGANCHALIISRYNTNKVESKFVSFYLNSKEGRNRLKDIETGTTMKHINVGEFQYFQIPLPPLPEQETIAEALSDADAWIESLEQLIAKKRLIKQGAMQELLSPKEDWEEKTIFEIADKKRDLFNDGDWIEAVHIKEEGIRLIQTGNIGVGRFLNKNNKKYISEKSFIELKCKEILEGDLLICRLAEPAGRVCIFPKTEDLKSVTSVDVTIYRPDKNIFDRRILLYLLSTDEWFKQVLEQVGGTTHKRISRGNLGNIKIKIPKSLTEQTRIAIILSDMDADLEALEAQLDKARKIKQGMMQELLTGKIRLV